MSLIPSVKVNIVNHLLINLKARGNLLVNKASKEKKVTKISNWIINLRSPVFNSKHRQNQNNIHNLNNNYFLQKKMRFSHQLIKLVQR